MAKTTPTIVVSGSVDFKILVLKFTDFRGQTVVKRITLDGSTADDDVRDIVLNIDMITNARIVTAQLESVVAITGMNASAQNALERNLSEVMSLGFQSVDPDSTVGRIVEKSINIPAMIAGIELNSGAPDLTNTNLAALVGTSGGSFLDGLISANLAFKTGTGATAFGMTFEPTESHHITVGDVVDNS
jgi:hypothetical protein